MAIKLIRIDDRYIHGQITVGWVRAYGINEIWVVDDKIASNPILANVQRGLAPPGVDVKIYRVDEAVKIIREERHDRNKNIMIIVSNPRDCLKILKAPENPPLINWVNVGQSSWGKGKVLIVKSYAVHPEEAGVFKEMRSMGVELVYKMLPDDKAVDFYELLRQKNLVE